MELVVECTKKIRVRDSTSESKSDSTSAADEAELAEHFPAFLWVLRDFALSLADDNGNPITSKQYLEAVQTRYYLTHFGRVRLMTDAMVTPYDTIGTQTTNGCACSIQESYSSSNHSCIS